MNVVRENKIELTVDGHEEFDANFIAKVHRFIEAHGIQSWRMEVMRDCGGRMAIGFVFTSGSTDSFEHGPKASEAPSEPYEEPAVDGQPRSGATATAPTAPGHPFIAVSNTTGMVDIPALKWGGNADAAREFAEALDHAAMLASRAEQQA